MNNWPLIEGKFSTSSVSKTVITQDERGRELKTKEKAIYLSDLIVMLCSLRMKVKQTEFERFGRDLSFSDSEVLHARKIAATKIVLNMYYDRNLKPSPGLETKLQNLLQRGDQLVVLKSIIDNIFPRDPLEFEAEMKKIYFERDRLLMELRDERRMKEEIRQKTESKKKKEMHALEKSLGTIQMSKGVLTLHRLRNLKSIVDFCRKAIAIHDVMSVLAVPIEVLEYVGKDVFPENIIEDSLKAAGYVQHISYVSKKKNEVSASNMVASEDSGRNGWGEFRPKKEQAIGYGGEARVPIGEYPGIISLLRDTVALGAHMLILYLFMLILYYSFTNII